MSLDTTQFWSHKLVHDELRSIATTENDAASRNQMSGNKASSVLTKDSVQTSARDAGSIGKRTNPSRRELTDAEIEERVDQVIKEKPGMLARNLADMWRHLHPSVLDCLYRRQRQAEEALAKGQRFEQDRKTVATADKTSIATCTSGSYSGSSVSSFDVKIKEEYPGEQSPIPNRRKRNKASTRDSTLLVTSAPANRRSDAKVVKSGKRPRRRRFDDSGKALRKTRIKQERPTRIKEEFEHDAVVSRQKNA